MQDKVEESQTWAKRIFFILLALLFFFIPFEHKYDKIFRYYSLTLIPPGLELPCYFDKKLYFYLSDLLILSLGGVCFYWLRTRLFEKSTLLLLGLFSCAGLSILFSPFAHYPLAYLRLVQFLTPITLFALLTSVPSEPKRLFKSIALSIVSVGCIQSLIGIAQYFTQENVGLRFLGEQPLEHGIYAPHGCLWIFDAGGAHVTKLYRAIGTLSHPNILGGLLALSLLFTGYLLWKTRSKWLLATYPVQLFALLITYCRSALFGWIIGSILWLIWMKWKQKVSIKMISLFITASFLVNTALLHEQIIHRGGVVNYNKATLASDNARLSYQKIALRVIQENPFFGIGFEQFTLVGPGGSVEKKSSADGLVINVHNIFLLLGAENGLPALLLFLMWIALLFFRTLKSSLEETGLLAAAFALLLFIGLCDFYPVVQQPGRLLFFGIAGLLARMTLPSKQLFRVESLGHLSTSK